MRHTSLLQLIQHLATYFALFCVSLWAYTTNAATCECQNSYPTLQMCFCEVGLTTYVFIVYWIEVN